MDKIRIAVATNGNKGIEDTVSDVFGRSTTFTIITLISGEIEGVESIENPATSYKLGAGPIATKNLADSGVNLVIAAEFGPGVSYLLDQFNIRKITAKPTTKVKNVIANLIKDRCVEKPVGKT